MRKNYHERIEQRWRRKNGHWIMLIGWAVFLSLLALGSTVFGQASGTFFGYTGFFTRPAIPVIPSAIEITTEGGDVITTEGGDSLVTE